MGKLSLFLGLLLFAAKFYAFILTHSSAILSDALESIINILGALVTLIIIKIAIGPADKEHPYGHGKAEYFGAAFEGGAISLAGIIIFLESSYLLWSQNYAPKNLTIGLGIVIAAGVFNGILGTYLQKKGRRLRSIALESSGKHLFSDFLTSLGIVVGLVLVSLTGWTWIDPFVAIIVSLQLTYHGFCIVKKSINGLMDARDLAPLSQLLDLFNKKRFAGIIRIHNVRIMHAGNTHHVDMHMVVPEYWTIEEGHEQSKKFAEKVFEKYEFDGEIHFHLDPCLKKYCAFCDYSPCPVRKEAFREVPPFEMTEILSPTEVFPNLQS